MGGGTKGDALQFCFIRRGEGDKERRIDFMVCGVGERSL